MSDIPSCAFVAGGICLDSVIRLGNLPDPEPATVFARSYNDQLGGTGAGKALALAKLGFSTTLYAFCGDDDAGALATAELAAGDVEFIKEIDHAGTERHTNLVDDEGRRISIYTNAGSFTPECLETARAEAALLATRYPILNIINRVRTLIPAARATGCGIWTDLHDYDGKDEYHAEFL
jgi:sugar/nucleoside kinase (ribokinase family)